MRHLAGNPVDPSRRRTGRIGDHALVGSMEFLASHDALDHRDERADGSAAVGRVQIQENGGNVSNLRLGTADWLIHGLSSMDASERWTTNLRTHHVAHTTRRSF
jgi:hypothetical protein